MTMAMEKVLTIGVTRVNSANLQATLLVLGNVIYGHVLAEYAATMACGTVSRTFNPLKNTQHYGY